MRSSHRRAVASRASRMKAASATDAGSRSATAMATPHGMRTSRASSSASDNRFLQGQKIGEVGTTGGSTDRTCTSSCVVTAARFPRELRWPRSAVLRHPELHEPEQVRQHRRRYDRSRRSREHRGRAAHGARGREHEQRGSRQRVRRSDRSHQLPEARTIGERHVRHVDAVGEDRRRSLHRRRVRIDGLGWRDRADLPVARYRHASSMPGRTRQPSLHSMRFVPAPPVHVYSDCGSPVSLSPPQERPPSTHGAGIFPCTHRRRWGARCTRRGTDRARAARHPRCIDRAVPHRPRACRRRSRTCRRCTLGVPREPPDIQSARCSTTPSSISRPLLFRGHCHRACPRRRYRRARPVLVEHELDRNHERWLCGARRGAAR